MTDDNQRMWPWTKAPGLQSGSKHTAPTWWRLPR